MVIAIGLLCLFGFIGLAVMMLSMWRDAAIPLPEPPRYSVVGRAIWESLVHKPGEWRICTTFDYLEHPSGLVLQIGCGWRNKREWLETYYKRRSLADLLTKDDRTRILIKVTLMIEAEKEAANNRLVKTLLGGLGR